MCIGKNRMKKTNEGNQCPQNLHNIHKINIPVDFKDYKQVLIDLKALHTACNSNVLPHDYVEVLNNFSSWKCLEYKFGIYTTLKLYIILATLRNLLMRQK